MSSPAARRTRRSERVLLALTAISAWTACIWGVWYLSSVSSASTTSLYFMPSRWRSKRENCPSPKASKARFCSFSSVRSDHVRTGEKYCSECCRRYVFRLVSLLGVPGFRPLPATFSEPFCLPLLSPYFFSFFPPFSLPFFLP